MMEESDQPLEMDLIVQFLYMLLPEVVIYHCVIPCVATLATHWTGEYFQLGYELELKSFLIVLFTVLFMADAIIRVEQSRAWSKLFANNRKIICWRLWSTVVLSLLIVWCSGRTIMDMVRDGSKTSQRSHGKEEEQRLEHWDTFQLEWSILTSCVLKIMYFNGIFANWTAFDGMISVLASEDSDQWNQDDYANWNDHSDNKFVVKAFEKILFESL